MAEYEAVKAIDPSRPIHYEGMNEIADMDARMYPSVESMIQTDRNGNQKPFFLCEYDHAMGNSIGNLDSYWDYISGRSERMIGGCIWDWVDQALNKPGEPDSRLYYGGSFGDSPNDNDFCCNGIVTADRQVTPKLLEVKTYISISVSGSMTPTACRFRTTIRSTILQTSTSGTGSWKTESAYAPRHSVCRTASPRRTVRYPFRWSVT